MRARPVRPEPETPKVSAHCALRAPQLAGQLVQAAVVAVALAVVRREVVEPQLPRSRLPVCEVSLRASQAEHRAALLELPRALERDGPRGEQLARLALQVTRSDHPSTDD